jgi:hypothetical protein
MFLLIPLRRGFVQTLQHKLSTLLDVILCLCNKYLIKSEVFHMPCSDHGLIMLVFNHSRSFNKPTKINSRCLNDLKILSLKTILLSTLSLSNFDRYITVESRWAAIKALLMSCINIAAPIKNMQVKTKNLVPWFDKDFFQKNVIDFITRPFPPK